MIEMIVSGGQTGADRAALDWAISKGVSHGGWCPKGRRSEDGTIPSRYVLRETHEANYLKRTEQNVIDSDGTAIFILKPHLTGGSKRIADFATKHQKPLLLLCAQDSHPARLLSEFVQAFKIKVLNIAGSRASNEPGINDFVTEVLDEFFAAAGR